MLKFIKSKSSSCRDIVLGGKLVLLEKQNFSYYIMPGIKQFSISVNFKHEIHKLAYFSYTNIVVVAKTVLQSS